MAHAASNVVAYTYDNAGNLVRIKRQAAAAGPSIAGFAPTSGAVGNDVTVTGAGFDTTAANNSVKFNGTVASVNTASATSLTVTVPASATTGPITVTVDSITATSVGDFIVTTPGGPTITGFTPDRGAAATLVTVTGTNFDPTPGATTVKLNQAPVTPSLVTATQITFAVPAATGSGRIRATTSMGTCLSATDFIVAPPTILATNIGNFVRFSADAPAQTVTDAGANKRVLLSFDAGTDAYLSFQFSGWASSPATATVPYALYKPDNTFLSSGAVSLASPTIHLPKLPVAGTYVLMLSPGLAAFTSAVQLQNNLMLPQDGPGVTRAVQSINQSIRMLINATAGQSLGLGIAGVTLAPTSVYSTQAAVNRPNGMLLDTAYCYTNTANGQCAANLRKLLDTGVHSVILTAPTDTRLTNAVATLSSDVALGELAADTPTPLAITRQGQNAGFTFQGVSGANLGVEVAGYGTAPVSTSSGITVYKPDGTYLASGSASATSQGTLIGLNNLPATGTYSAYLDPAYGGTASAQLKIKTGTALPFDGASQSAAMTVIGESPYFKFTGTSGQNVSLALTGLAYHAANGNATTVTVYTPSGGTHATLSSCSSTNWGGGCRIALPQLTASGTYTVVVTPPAGIRLTAGDLWLSTPVTGTLTPGAPYPLTLGRPGQGARLAVAVTAGALLAIEGVNIATTPANQSLTATLLRPNNAYFAASGNTTRIFTNGGALPDTGTYTVTIEPTTASTSTVQLTADNGITISADGNSQSIVTTLANETVLLTFSGTAAQKLDFALTGLTLTPASSYTVTLGLNGPTGSAVNSANCATSNPGAGCSFNQAGLPTTGVYSLTASHQLTSTFTGSVTVSNPLAGALAVGGAGTTFGPGRAGQSARLTFPGTSGQLLRLNWSAVAIAPAGIYAQVYVYNPSGGLLNSGSFTNGATGGLDITSLPATGTYTVVVAPAYGASATATLNLLTR